MVKNLSRSSIRSNNSIKSVKDHAAPVYIFLSISFGNEFSKIYYFKRFLKVLKRKSTNTNTNKKLENISKVIFSKTRKIRKNLFCSSKLLS